MHGMWEALMLSLVVLSLDISYLHKSVILDHVSGLQQTGLRTMIHHSSLNVHSSLLCACARPSTPLHICVHTTLYAYICGLFMSLHICVHTTVSHNWFYYTSKPECAIPDDNAHNIICIHVWIAYEENTTLHICVHTTLHTHTYVDCLCGKYYATYLCAHNIIYAHVCGLLMWKILRYVVCTQHYMHIYVDCSFTKYYAIYAHCVVVQIFCHICLRQRERIIFEMHLKP